MAAAPAWQSLIAAEVQLEKQLAQLAADAALAAAAATNGHAPLPLPEWPTVPASELEPVRALLSACAHEVGRRPIESACTDPVR